MKKTVYFIALLLCLTDCTNLPTGPASPPCDDTERTFTVSLDWTNASYNSTCTGISSFHPPFGNGQTYISDPSNPLPTTNTYGYYCKVLVQSACTRNSGSSYNKSYLWTPAGGALQIKSLKNEPTQITVEYYCPCTPCNGGASTHPYFIGVTTVPVGATTVIMQMTNQTYKPC